jgi:hypothetical protein
LKEDLFLLFPREIGPTLYDTIVGACRKAGFEPIIGQLAAQIASVVNLVAAELGVSIVPASMMQVRATALPIGRLQARRRRRGLRSPTRAVT